MNTKQNSTGLISKIQDKTLRYSVLAMTAGSSFVAMTANAQDFDDIVNADRDASNSMLSTGTGGAESGLGTIYNLVKWVAIVIGLVLAISGLMYVSKASKSEGQKSQMPGWITFGIGGLMTVVGVFMFAVGKSAVEVIGSQGSSTGP
ncbi:hypothetical protein [Psychrobacter sp. AOP31-A1-22]|uniref:hypothetical protein n=1 Tax=Psychrobacter sp. AOP31-A1-22 TaxID=3457696 RepID=UPI00403678D2